MAFSLIAITEICSSTKVEGLHPLVSSVLTVNNVLCKDRSLNGFPPEANEPDHICGVID